MAGFVPHLETLIEQFQKLPGVGYKTALRMAFGVLDFSNEEAEEFAQAILAAKQKIVYCKECQNISDSEFCPICQSAERERSTVCVVEDPKAVLAFERIKEYRGLYHVLHGVISPMDGVGPDKLKIRELLTRISSSDEIEEIIIATNPTIEGEATAMYIAKLIKPSGIKVSRLALGLPVGGELEYADEVTLFRAIEGRNQL